LGVVFAPREHYVGTTPAITTTTTTPTLLTSATAALSDPIVVLFRLGGGGCPLPTAHYSLAHLHANGKRATCDLPNQLQVRFAAPVLPGSKLTVEMWAEGDRILFVTLVDGKVVINNAYVDLTPSARM
jgi:hypothetical protein